VIAAEEASLLPLLDTRTIDWKEETPPARFDQILAVYERSAAAVDERLARVDEAAWQKPGRFLWEGRVAWQDPVGQMVWYILFDLIHHRGQLSTYLRPMGGKVPSIYGPSGDDPARDDSGQDDAGR
jgi:uncharacterized damage-inducible protein DinB